MKQLITILGIIAVAFTLSIQLPAQVTRPNSKKTLMGDPVRVGNGIARSWITVGKAGNPTAIGLTFDEASLTGLPTEQPMYEYILPLPKGTSSAPFESIVIDWNPRGHIPQQIYGVPHFDYHFYMISTRDRDKITAVGEDMKRMERVPEARYIPKDYKAFPGGVPQMGAHWYDVNTPEMHGKPFTRTLLYGFYNGQMIFIEPMITVAYLQTKPNVTEPIAQPQAYQKPGYYPTNYSVKYDPNNNMYTVGLGGMVKR